MTTTMKSQNGVKDNFGVLYSNDGKKLLTAGRFQVEHYRVKDGTEIICDRAFNKCSCLMEIDLPDSLRSIGDSAFADCNNLFGIKLPKGLKHIGSGAFSECHSLDNVNLPEGITRIGDGTFCWCATLTSITLPDTITSIGDEAFGSCGMVTENFKFPKDLKHIGADVFENCVDEDLEIPEGVKVGEYEDSVWNKDCEETKYDAPYENPYEGDTASYPKKEKAIIIDGIKFSEDGVRLISCIDKKRTGAYKVPEGTKVICNDAFMDCKDITDIELPEGLITIGGRAFAGCKSLKGIHFPTGLRYIGWSAFAECTGITCIDIPMGLDTIEEGTFGGCTSLRKITLPRTLTMIGEMAFEDCPVKEAFIPEKATTKFEVMYEDLTDVYEELSLSKN